MTAVVDRLEFREGGVWRFVQRDRDGNEYAFDSVYKEIVIPERITNALESCAVDPMLLIDAREFDESTGIAAQVPVARAGTIEVRPVLEMQGLPREFGGARPAGV